jgi:hypothetical protein
MFLLVDIPARMGYRPVIMPAREGEQIGAGA